VPEAWGYSIPTPPTGITLSLGGVRSDESVYGYFTIRPGDMLTQFNGWDLISVHPEAVLIASIDLESGTLEWDPASWLALRRSLAAEQAELVREWEEVHGPISAQARARAREWLAD